MIEKPSAARSAGFMFGRRPRPAAGKWADWPCPHYDVGEVQSLIPLELLLEVLVRHDPRQGTTALLPRQASAMDNNLLCAAVGASDHKKRSVFGFAMSAQRQRVLQLSSSPLAPPSALPAGVRLWLILWFGFWHRFVHDGIVHGLAAAGRSGQPQKLKMQVSCK